MNDQPVCLFASTDAHLYLSDDIASTALFHNNASQETMNLQLGGLRDQIERVGCALRSRMDLQASPSIKDRDQNGRISRNLRRCVYVAESFHSNASWYVGTIYGDSILGNLAEDRGTQFPTEFRNAAYLCDSLCSLFATYP